MAARDSVIMYVTYLTILCIVLSPLIYPFLPKLLVHCKVDFFFVL